MAPRTTALLQSATKHAPSAQHVKKQQQQELADLQAILEDLTVEGNVSLHLLLPELITDVSMSLNETADSRLRTLRSKQETYLATIERTWRSTIATLPEQIRNITLGDFLDLYQADTEVALRAVAERDLKVQPIIMAEQNLRTRSDYRAFHLI
jgi:hypothetical protein